MSHEPECVQFQKEAIENAGGWDYGFPCLCELLKLTRADERLEQIGGGEAWNIGFEDGYESAVVFAVSAVEDLYRRMWDESQDFPSAEDVVAAIRSRS